MADTRTQMEVVAWLCGFLPEKYPGRSFSTARVKLSSGGTHEFNAVSRDREVIVSVITSDSRTSSGKLAVGKLTKVRADMFFLLLVDAKTKVLAFTQEDMYELCLKEKELGRIPEDIQLEPIHLPAELAERLAKSKKAASEEVRP